MTQLLRQQWQHNAVWSDGDPLRQIARAPGATNG